VFRAFVQGWKLALQAPAVTAGILMGSFALEMPANHIRRLVGQDREVLIAFPLDGWMAGFSRGTQGLEWPSRTTCWGSAALPNSCGLDAPAQLVSELLDRRRWIGSHGGPVRAPAFFSACGVYFFRFLRLGAVSGAVYWVLFRLVFPLVDSGAASEGPPGDATGWHVVLSLFCLLAIVGITVLADYAKVRAVIEDRISMIGAIAASWRFVRRRPIRVLLLFLMGALMGAGVIALPRAVGINAGSPGWVLLLFALGTQVLFVWIRLAFMASAVVFFQSQQAHADYTAAPLPVWPESPAAEAIGNFAGRR
jgi:hypothetical protein